MKPRNMFVMMATIAAACKSFFFGKKHAAHNSTQPPEKRTGKSKGGRKAKGLISGLGKPSPRGTALGNWLYFDGYYGKYAPKTDQRPAMEPNWHRASRAVR